MVGDQWLHQILTPIILAQAKLPLLSEFCSQGWSVSAQGFLTEDGGIIEIPRGLSEPEARGLQVIRNLLWRTNIHSVWLVHHLHLKETALPPRTTAPEPLCSACDSLIAPDRTKNGCLTKGQQNVAKHGKLCPERGKLANQILTLKSLRWVWSDAQRKSMRRTETPNKLTWGTDSDQKLWKKTKDLWRSQPMVEREAERSQYLDIAQLC